MVAGQAEGGDAHDQNFQQLDRDDHAAFAEPCGERTAQHGEKQKRQHQQRQRQRRKPVLLHFTHPETDADEQGQLLERVVIERALKLCDNECPETAQARGLYRFRTRNIRF